MTGNAARIVVADIFEEETGVIYSQRVSRLSSSTSMIA